MAKMPRAERRRFARQTAAHGSQLQMQSPVVDSLLPAMEDGKEYGSIVSTQLKVGTDILGDVEQSLRDIEHIRGRPCLLYTGNVLSTDKPESAIDMLDDLPFQEMVNQVPGDVGSVDILLTTLGGSASQVNRFVHFLRPRFDEVDFLIPTRCMSAGTLFALSGNRIWMTPGACLGPIDPQVPTGKDRRLVSAQALLVLLRALQEDGQAALAKGQPPPWTAVRIVDHLDQKEIGDALTASAYCKDMAVEFLVRYKFKNWATRQTTGIAVDEAYRRLRADEIATALVSHERWKAHGHALSRDVLLTEIRLKIDHPDAALERALRRAWALYQWIFEKTPIVKVFCSTRYRYARYTIQQIVKLPSQ